MGAMELMITFCINLRKNKEESGIYPGNDHLNA